MWRRNSPPVAVRICPAFGPYPHFVLPHNGNPQSTFRHRGESADSLPETSLYLLMADNMPLNRAIVSSLLRSPLQTEEDRHPWGLKSSTDLDKPLLRTWDKFSGSKPSSTGIMLSRSPRERLDTPRARKEFLTIHADHQKWDDTPFISFTQSPQELQDTAELREPRRGYQTITVLNPNVRAKKGLPILNMDAEMRYYGIPDPYGKSNKYYKNHYVCLWEVTEEEFIGNWLWEELLRTDRWYEQVILPAFERHNDKHLVNNGALNMSDLRDALLETQTPSIKALAGPYRCFSRDVETSSEDEEYEVWFEEESDSYDEVEERNAMDDALKTLED